MRGVMKRLNRRRFEVFILSLGLPTEARDYVSEELEAVNEQEERKERERTRGGTSGGGGGGSSGGGNDNNAIPPHNYYFYGQSFEFIRHTIASLQLDVLVYGELGTEIMRSTNEIN